MLDLVKSQRQAVEDALRNANNPLWVDSATVKDNQSSYDRFLLALAKQRELSREELAQELANQLAKRADEQNRREIAENLKRQAGVDLQEFLGNSERVQERLQQLTTANVALIKSIPTQYLDKVELAVTQAIVKGDLSSELTKKIMEIGQSTEKRAKLIARDQVSKFNAALTQARHEDLGITHYRWSTSGDERVRESHIENDGKIFAYDDPPDETGHPGHDINCRCVAIPVLDKAEIERAKSEEEQGQKTGFKSGKMDLEELIDNSLSGSGNKLFSNIGVIHPDLVDLAKESTGLDVSDWQHSVDEAGIRHIFKKHGDEKQENLRGQRAVTKTDLLLLPLIISKFDSIEYAGTSETGNDIFLVKKEINDEIFTVQEIRKKNKKLSLKTMWIRKKSKKRKP